MNDPLEKLNFKILKEWPPNKICPPIELNSDDFRIISTYNQDEPCIFSTFSGKQPSTPAVYNGIALILTSNIVKLTTTFSDPSLEIKVVNNSLNIPAGDWNFNIASIVTSDPPTTPRDNETPELGIVVNNVRIPFGSFNTIDTPKNTPIEYSKNVSFSNSTNVLFYILSTTAVHFTDVISTIKKE